MAKDPKRRQKALARKAAKRKARHNVKSRQGTGAGGQELAGAGKWPLLDCLVSETWQDSTQLCQILISRQAPHGVIGAGIILMDLACLGLKSASVGAFHSVHDYRAMRDDMTARRHMTSCDVALAAKIVEEGVTYAEGLGFQAHREGRKAIRLFGDADPRACSERIRLGGKAGRPLFIASPNDNVPMILATLDRTVGPGRYDFMAPDGSDGFNPLDRNGKRP